MGEYVLEMNNITKVFPGVKALDGVTLKVQSRQRACPDGRKRRRKIDFDEVFVRHLPRGWRRNHPGWEETGYQYVETGAWTSAFP